MPDRGTSAVITGATGFIGGHLLRRLIEDGWHVCAVVRSEASQRELEDAALAMAPRGRFVALVCSEGDDETLARQIAAANPAVLFHLASLFLVQHVPRDIARLVESNIGFGTRVLDACVNAGCKALVHAGTSWQHYEDETYNPVNLYAATKQAFADVATYYARAHGLRTTALHLFETYGPRDKRPKLIQLLFNAAASGTSLQMSPGAQLLHLLHVEDVVRAFVAASRLLLDSNTAGLEAAYGLPAAQPCSIRDLVCIVERVTRCLVNVTWGARPYRNREVMRPWQSGATLPGWRPEVELPAGLRELWECEYVAARRITSAESLPSQK